MTATTGPRFDDSLASVARSLHLGAVGLFALLGALALFAWLERRGRRNWTRPLFVRSLVDDSPYRSSEVVAAYARRAPVLVQLTSLGSFGLALFFMPVVVLALASYPFDVIAIPLLPGLAFALGNAWCACLFLARSPRACAIAHGGAIGSLMSNVGLLLIAALHFGAVELQRREGIQHACSSSVTFLVFVFAASSVAHALMTLALLRRYADNWAPNDDSAAHEPTPRRGALPRPLPLQPSR